LTAGFISDHPGTMMIPVNTSLVTSLFPELPCQSLQEYAKRKEKMLQLRKQKEEEVFQSKQAEHHEREKEF